MARIAQLMGGSNTFGSDFHCPLPHYVVSIPVVGEPDVPCACHIGCEGKGTDGLTTFGNGHLSAAEMLALVGCWTGKEVYLTRILFTMVLEHSLHRLPVAHLVVAGEIELSQCYVLYRTFFHGDVSLLIDDDKDIGDVGIYVGLPHFL